MPRWWGEVGRKRGNGGEGWLKKEESGVKWGIERESTLTAGTTFNLGEGDTRCFLAPTNPALMKKVA
jgi:hypothetical protein